MFSIRMSFCIWGYLEGMGLGRRRTSVKSFEGRDTYEQETDRGNWERLEQALSWIWMMEQEDRVWRLEIRRRKWLKRPSERHSIQLAVISFLKLEHLDRLCLNPNCCLVCSFQGVGDQTQSYSDVGDWKRQKLNENHDDLGIL
ncbi:hypothetical protein L1987_02251 [Smallanthus sonchifolius]|uniref:Uncharacterized protein n=1 Tax=Smallanthus sonchifolius TaxID=185202 RepID=A0ACB9K7G3_9ASTR|nr:hypothetical protein L1987_02251 [Smallanthus sonchifolius]